MLNTDIEACLFVESFGISHVKTSELSLCCPLWGENQPCLGLAMRSQPQKYKQYYQFSFHQQIMISVSLAKINKNPRFHKKYGDFFEIISVFITQ
jgi:hypothetical protein